MKVTEFINNKVTYDKDGQILWIGAGGAAGTQMLAQLRGWGRIQQMFNRPQYESKQWFKAEAFQDQVGEWVAAAINEKLEREKP